MTKIVVRVQTADFLPDTEVDALRDGHLDVGAVVSFIGTVRNRNDGSAVSNLELEHYPGMTEQSLREIAEQAAQRWPLGGVCIVHRVGPMAPGERIVLAACTSAHRQAAFEACAFVMDYLKTQAPFWKKEQTPEGARWVDARESDDAALARWQASAGCG